MTTKEYTKALADLNTAVEQWIACNEADDEDED